MLLHSLDETKMAASRLRMALLASTLAAVQGAFSSDGYPSSPIEIPSRRRLCESHSTRIAAEHLCTPDTCVFDPANFKYSATLKARESEADTGYFIYWTFNDDEDEIAIGVDAHNAGGYVGLGISANGGMMGADIWMLAAATGRRPRPHRAAARHGRRKRGAHQAYERERRPQNDWMA